MLTSGVVVKSDPFASARQRAYELAATGDYLLWPNIAQVLASEGFSVGAIKQIGKDVPAQDARRRHRAALHQVDRAGRAL